MIATGDEIRAEEAKQIGLINQVFDDETFSTDLDAYLEKFLKTSKSATKLTKRLLYQVDSLSFLEALESGVDVNVIARMTDDCQQGIAKFLKK